MHNCGAIFYNHESPRRTKEYVTQKIVHGVCDIYNNKKKVLHLGDLNAKIDWGYAKDYVEASYRIMQLTKPDIFVIASGKGYTVEHFAKKCFQYVGLNYKNYLSVNKKLFRKSKTSSLIGDTTKAKRVFGFKIKTDLDKLVSIMMKNDLKNESNE